MGLLTKPTKLSSLDVIVQKELTARELLMHLLERGGQIGHKEDFTADPYGHFMILVNGLYLSELEGYDTLLKDQDSVVILAPIIGGSHDE